MNTQTTNENSLGTQPVKKLLMQFAIPSIVAMLVSSLYNIVDQFFIGRNVGELGNAATNISFPLSISCIAIALLFGIGGMIAGSVSAIFARRLTTMIAFSSAARLTAST